MNKIEELEKEFENLVDEFEKKLEDLKKRFDECEKSGKVNKRWRAKKDEYYWFLCSDLKCDYDSEDFWEQDAKRYEIYNYFQTREEAEKVAEKIKIYIELKDLAEELNAGEEIDWENEYQAKYYIYKKYPKKILEQDFNWSWQDFGQIYCLNKDFLKIAKERIGEERLLKLFE